MIYSLIFFALAGISNAVMDTLQHHFWQSIFNTDRFNHKWWDPEESWSNKYKNNKEADGPKFPGSTTVFVFVTDAWHLFQFLMITFCAIAVVIPMNYHWLIKIAGVLLLKLAWSGLFIPAYKKWFIR